MTCAKNMMALERRSSALTLCPSRDMDALGRGGFGFQQETWQNAEFQTRLTVMLCPSQELAQHSDGVAVPSRAALSWIPALPGLSSSFIFVLGLAKSMNKPAVPTASLHKANEGLVVEDVVGSPVLDCGVALVRMDEGTLGFPA